MSRDLSNGRWYDVENQEQFQCLKTYGVLKRKGQFTARVQIGDYQGPGRYLLLRYDRPYPRGCCYDDVNEVISANEVAEVVKEEIRQLAQILKRARGVEE